MRKFLTTLVISLIFTQISLFCANKAAITVDTKNPSTEKVRDELFGGFIEFLNDFIDNQKGMWAQELINRGFDMTNCDNNNVSCYWQKWQSSLDQQVQWTLEPGGFNQNGSYSQKISKLDNVGKTGVMQKIFLSENTSNRFYVYLKGDEGIDNVELILMDTLLTNELFSASLGKPQADFNKFEVVVPNISNVYKANLIIACTGIGNLFIDEASFVPENNVGGVRKEYFDLYNNWKTGVLRYPGGAFADLEASKLVHSIGNIDQRNSPNLGASWFDQRMDFGTDEFINFCKTIGIEPHITINLDRGTPEEAAAWVEYCNGSATSTWGSVRASNGHPDSYNVKYWEIGNEQYNNTSIMATKYLGFYDKMKETDPSITIITDGNIWGGHEYFDTLMTIIGKKCQIYGWHHAISGRPTEAATDEEVYLSMVGSSHNIEDWVGFVDNWLNEKNLYPDVKQGISEWWSDYGTPEDWLLDTNYRNSSLESGLWAAGHLNFFMRHPASFILGERTSGLGLIRHACLPNGKRVVFGTPSYWALSMNRNHHGQYNLPVATKSDTFSTRYISHIWQVINSPYIDATATVSSDKLFLHVLNRHPSDSIKTDLNYSCDWTSDSSTVYQLNSNSYMDANTVEHPELVKPSLFKVKTEKTYTFPPHSYTIIEIPCTGIVSVQGQLKNGELAVISPNPFINEFRIDLADVQNNHYEIDIFNSIGQNIINKTLPEGSNEVSMNLPGQPIGVYHLVIRQGSNIHTYQIVKIGE